jgi:hypothetical protein
VLAFLRGEGVLVSQPRLVFSGMIAGTPHQGGATWAVLQYLAGFRRLGWDVHFVEPVADLHRADGSIAYCREVMTAFGLERRWTLVDPASGETAGTTRRELDQVAAAADLLVNVSGMLTDTRVLDAVPTRVYLDLDPAFVQLWHAVEGIDMRFDAHDRFVTIGATIGHAGSPVPDCGLPWIATLPPVVLEHWPVATDPPQPVLTTVAHWRGYGSIELDGRSYGQKAHSWRALFELPSLVEPTVRVALAIHDDETEDLAALRASGWQLADPDQVAGSPGAYQRFVRSSMAELCVAKSGYVVSRSGWFSDRSACYLASGRPVVAQDTGFGDRLPTGEGLLAFNGVTDAAEAVALVTGDYPHHCAAARIIAEEHLDSDLVLGALVDRVMASPSSRGSTDG